VASGDTVSPVSPTPGQRVCGTFTVVSVEALGPELWLASVARDGGGEGDADLVAVKLEASTGADLGRLLADHERYRIGIEAVARALAHGLEGDLLCVVYERTQPHGIVRGAPMERPALAHLVTTLAGALAPLHDQGIAFGAIRPELLRMGATGTCAQGFGLETLVRRVADDRRAVELVPLAYRAPEQRTSTPGPASPAADVFALGALVTELLIGRPLTDSDERPTPRACGTDVSDAVESLISKAVARSPVARPSQLARWAEELAEALVRPYVPRVAQPDAVAEPSRAEQQASQPESPPAPAPQPLVPEPAARAENREPPGVVPTPPPLREPAPSSVRSGRGSWLWVLAVIGAALLFLFGVGGLFAYSLMRTATVAVAPPTVADAGTLPPPVVAPPPPATSPVESVDAGADASSTEPSDAAAPPYSTGPRVVSAEEASAPIPLADDVPQWGSAEALVTVVVFGDLECPHTRKAERALQGLMRAFPKELRVAFRHRPLSIHPRARDAARVAIGLRKDQGDAAFFRLYSSLAAGSDSAERTRLEAWVSAAGGDGSKVGKYLSDPETERILSRDLELAGQFDVRETPTFFVNGVRVDGLTAFDDLKSTIEKELASSRSLLTLGTAPTLLYAARVRKNLMGLGPKVVERTCPAVVGSPMRGATDALVTLVEFSDFECPFCRRAQPTLDTLLARHGGDLRIVWKNFPLDNHPRARPAAAFALEVFEKQGAAKFWKVHDLLFASEAGLSDSAFEAIALKASLDPTPLIDAARTRTHDPKIDADARAGLKIGVKGTPTFFVNGRMLSGAQPVEQFEVIVKEELEAARRLIGSGTARSRIYDALCGVR